MTASTCASAPGYEAPSVSSSDTGLRRVLLVDDQAHVLRVMKLTLDRNGYEVDTALNGEVALRLLAENHYDAVVTDLDMPSMNGQTLCEQIHEQLKPLTPLILVVTDDETQSNLAWVEQFDNTEFLEKPLSLRWLVARLSEYFGHFESAMPA